MNIHNRLQKIKLIAYILAERALPPCFQYESIRNTGFEEDLNDNNAEILNGNLLQQYEANLQKIRDENISERVLVLENGDYAQLLKFKHNNELFYHLKINNEIYFQYIHQNSEGKWQIMHPLTINQSWVYLEIFPFL